MGYGDKIGTMRGELRALYQAAPAATTGFSALTKGVMDGGPLGCKEKEFIALGMALALRCKAGASREELVDVLGVAIQMGGGPAVMYTGHALACWDELTAARG
jgi:alkylhydroperoxidase/carboxymuconolactone decarboxylase family protein YurZ